MITLHPKHRVIFITPAHGQYVIALRDHHEKSLPCAAVTAKFASFAKQLRVAANVDYTT
ncbi:hypothetical protein [Ferrimonas aestuarii]|uniref:hypothetical protein n=1 Tax=Ferrimonas aestuarii TaxID=2569539 RepID=UPI00145D0171|nr:hypothetical protein [Ferrimonas aestuarii]